MAKKSNSIIPNIEELEKALDGDLDLVTFFLSWIKNGRNATKAYLELNPHVDSHSARVLGSRQLAKVNIRAIMETYGLGIEEYFTQLAEGNQAMKWNDFTGEREPDHRVRKDYHDKLGKLLGVEQDKGMVNNEVKILVVPSELIEKYDTPITPDASNSSQR